MSDYDQFLATKHIELKPSGFSVSPDAINPKLFSFQRDIVIWALARGRAALFCDCGAGKTPMQLEWARHVLKKVKKPILILAPLAVSHQTVREGQKFDIEVVPAISDMDVRKPAIYVTNYEKLDHFNASRFGGIVLDESSILKSYSGATRNALIERFSDTSYRLACTATPAPNDYMELGNHSEFLGALTRTQMLSTFFVHDGGDTSKWRLKGHAEEEYWKWVCSWAVMMRKPSDLGYSDDGFVLPELKIHHEIVKGKPIEGFLFQVEAQSMIERRQARKASLEDRVRRCTELVATKPLEPWLLWCDLNDEGDALEKAIPNAIQVAGKDSDKDKEDRMIGFSDGKYQVLATKSKIAGHGMNWQHCPNVIFCGLSDSWESYYQAIRRVWRYGQKREVNCYIVTSESEGAVVQNIERKERDAARMASEMVRHMSVYNQQALRSVRQTEILEPRIEQSNSWTMHLNDCVEVVRLLKDESIGLSLFSPPYSQLYCYSASDRDMGNSRGDQEFFQHFDFLVSELHRVTQSGRIVAVDCMNLPAMKERDGYIGLKDFRGALIKHFTDHGFIYHSEHVVWKDPLIEATRTKSIGLMHKQLVKDSAMSRAGLPQYLLAFRKRGENKNPIAHLDGMDTFYGEDAPTKGNLSHERWRRYASPVWDDVSPSNTLQKESAREDKDEKHICPMALDMIERAIWLWSKEGDLVFDPFSGIGSTGYVAVQRGRNFIGAELKRSYFEQAVKNLQNAENMAEQDSLFAATA